ncbi:hypothetical protein N7456_005504 [Penicillium angulare]|uniref:MYND-type domain-containing protein n=1 Tax=Penicillium angulare TaxID=116970 RepID=A0A9W9FYN0_9EURO|nr:hypothetical protein N7456_005504 [Penicillium angulare]
MGRWGHRMFEGDRDFDLLGDLQQHVGMKEKWEYSMAEMVMTGLSAEKKKYVREKFDVDNYGDTLFANCKAKEGEWEGKYCTIILGTVLMSVGARISSQNMKHLRKLAGEVQCNPGFTLCLFDDGFRAPGRAQFLAALDHYQPGKPRNFLDLSCFYCGKTGEDTGNPMFKCGKCKVSWYCDKDCQRGHWKYHKSECAPPGSRWMLNV